MEILKIALYIVWGIVFIAWIVSFVLRIHDELYVYIRNNHVFYSVGQSVDLTSPAAESLASK